MHPVVLCFCIIVLVGSAVASDVPFIFDANTSELASYTSAQLEWASISCPDLIGVPPVTTATGNVTLKVPVVGGGNNPQGITEKKVGDLRNLFDTRIEPDNSKVHELAINILGDHPGDYTIDQICEIFSYLVAGDGHKKGWSYIGPPRGINNFFYANQTIRQSENKDYVGAGDCGDFAILMSALVESIGGTTRVILASNNSTVGHAYAQVYIGRGDIPNSPPERVIKYLMQVFEIDNVFTYVDTNTKDVWLNLDWWPDQKGVLHPGGPFVPGDANTVFYIRQIYPTCPPKLPIAITIFKDDFSEYDKKWISYPLNQIYHNSEENNVHYSTNRGQIQVMYHSINHFKDNFHLSIDVMITDTNGNGFVYIGLTDDINNVPARWWEGPGIEIGYYGGSYYADVAGRYENGTAFVSMSDDPNKDKSITISANKWYTIGLTKIGQNWKLDVYSEDGNLVKSVTGEFTGNFAPYNYILFGNGDQSQWETAGCKLDNVLITNGIEV